MRPLRMFLLLVIPSNQMAASQGRHMRIEVFMGSVLPFSPVCYDVMKGDGPSVVCVCVRE